MCPFPRLLQEIRKNVRPGSLRTMTLEGDVEALVPISAIQVGGKWDDGNNTKRSLLLAGEPKLLCLGSSPPGSLLRVFPSIFSPVFLVFFLSLVFFLCFLFFMTLPSSATPPYPYPQSFFTVIRA